MESTKRAYSLQRCKSIRRRPELLQQKLTEAAATGDAIISECDEHGQRYILDFECIREGQRAVVRSGWIVLTGEDFPRLTTCYVLSK